MATNDKFSFSSFQYARREFVTRLALSMASCFCYTTLANTSTEYNQPRKAEKKNFFFFFFLLLCLDSVPTPSKMMMMALYYRALYIYSTWNNGRVILLVFFFGSKVFKTQSTNLQTSNRHFFSFWVRMYYVNKMTDSEYGRQITKFRELIISWIAWSTRLGEDFLFLFFFQIWRQFFFIWGNAHLPQLTWRWACQRVQMCLI